MKRGWRVAWILVTGIWGLMGGMGSAAAKSVDDLPYTEVRNCLSAQVMSRMRPADKVLCDVTHAADTKDLPIVQEVFLTDNFIVSAYSRVLSDLPMDSPEQARVIAEQKQYLDERDACGKDLHCIERVQKQRLDQLHEIRDRLERPLPEEALVRLTKGWRTPDGQSLTERLFAGLNIYPLRRVTDTQGRQLLWGFAPHDAATQSAVLLDPQGKVVALAIADGVYLSFGREEGTLRVYMAEPKESRSVLPLLLSWAAASGLGFNQNCQGTQSARCATALRHPAEVFLYDLHCKSRSSNGRCALPLPSVTGQLKDVSLFWN